MATWSLPCSSELASVDTGTNRFTSNVSLVILKPNVTYVVTSGQQDCERGLGFYFSVPPDPSQKYYVDRDVGVADNLGYTLADANFTFTLVTSFGDQVPPQNSAYIYQDPDHNRTLFNGDLLNLELPGAYQMDLYTNGDSPASASKFEDTNSFKGADYAQTYLFSVGLAGVTGQPSGFQKYYHITVSIAIKELSSPARRVHVSHGERIGFRNLCHLNLCGGLRQSSKWSRLRIRSLEECIRACSEIHVC